MSPSRQSLQFEPEKRGRATASAGSSFHHEPIDLAVLARHLARHYAIELESCETLDSERDRNFRVRAVGSSFVLKIAGADSSPDFIAAQCGMLDAIRDAGIEFCPETVASVSGSLITKIELADGEYAVRLVRWIDGPLVSTLGYLSPELLANWGHSVARVDIALRNFDHPGLHRKFHWDLACAESVIDSGLQRVKPDDHREAIGQLFHRAGNRIAVQLRDLPRSAIHNDANDANLVAEWSADALSPDQVKGLIDFGDAVYSWTVGDLAIAIAYAWLKSDDLLETARQVAAGYHAVRPLTEVEAEAVFGLACWRLCVSAVIAAEQVSNNPGNHYLDVSQPSIRETIPRLLAIPQALAQAALRTTCGFDALRHQKKVRQWIAAQAAGAPFPVNPHCPGERPNADTIYVLDLGVDSPLLTADPESYDQPSLTRLIEREMAAHHATTGVGQYLEPRLLYSSDQYTESVPGASSRHTPCAVSQSGVPQIIEPADDDSTNRQAAAAGDCLLPRRTVHLGIDLFAPAGTPLVSPLAGQVVVATAIDRPLDYGGVVILRHATDEGQPFFSLYGHLDPQSFATLREGSVVKAGDTIARLGTPAVNGGWPPHLHFQIMLDLLELGEEFPGVCRASEEDIWRQISPDPNGLLGIPQNCFPAAKPDFSTTRKSRERLVGSALSLSYRRPLKLVRGYGSSLFDHRGRRFLDAWNNVPHVGHCHPAVVAAVHRQMQCLNTNTRFLHDNIHELAARVVETLPAALEVCWFLNSASEANELALRLAAAHTSGQDIIVLRGAYHGHTQALIDVSPYKFDGPGGRGQPPHVHCAPLPDVYRGEFRNPETAGSLYAESVRDGVEQVAQRGGRLSAFLVESCPSVAGQIIPPRGFLSGAFAAIREAGGVCIADEVQTGWGRLGSVFYGFELDNAIPDIVVLGKSIGNGHPLAAVITTRAIANSFASGMEFFSTFGGNPVSCAAGIAVLDVLRDEGLAENARATGTVILDGLRGLQKKFPVVGDVRGMGFFIGVELICPGNDRIPDDRAAEFVVNRLRDNGVLIGRDGLDNNVLKIRPPMCFSGRDSIALLGALEHALAEWNSMPEWR